MIYPSIFEIQAYNSRAKVLEGTTIVLSGIIPLGADFMRYLNSNLSQYEHDVLLGDEIYWLEVTTNMPRYRSEIALQAQSFGADLQTKISRKITHLVTPTSKTRTHKVRQAARYPDIKIVNLQWLLDSMSKWEKQDESHYLVSHQHSHTAITMTHITRLNVLTAPKPKDPFHTAVSKIQWIPTTKPAPPTTTARIPSQPRYLAHRRSQIIRLGRCR